MSVLYVDENGASLRIEGNKANQQSCNIENNYK